MKTPPCILIVDDQPMNVDILQARLAVYGYELLTATDGEEALQVTKAQQPDLLLLDVMMPKLDGFEVCRQLRADPDVPYMPIIMVTARGDTEDVVTGLEAGADEYLTKPVDQAALVARVKSMLRIKALHDTVQEQATQLETWSETLEQRVQDQVGELERAGRLKRFLAPQLAELVVSSGGEALLQSHRREVTMVCCDLHGFTAFSETAEPEEVMDVLRAYHTTMGSLIFQYEGTLERFTGGGFVVFFNDPLPCADPAMRAVRMSLEMRQQMAELHHQWSRRGYQLDFVAGIAHGYATLGMIGFAGRMDYNAIGPVSNLAMSLCEEAQDGHILISQRVLAAVDDVVHTEAAGDLSLRGLPQAVPVFRLLDMK